MTPDQFVVDAVRTESRIENVTLNHNFFIDLTSAMIALGSILDQIKKHTYYKKPYDVAKIRENLMFADIYIKNLSNDIDAKLFPNEAFEKVHPVNTRIFHAIVGIATEAVELLQAMNIDEPDVDKVNLLEEFGDIGWYQAIGVDAVNGSFEDVLEKVIAKLRARFPNKFTNEDAINRDLVKERQVLEGSQDNP